MRLFFRPLLVIALALFIATLLPGQRDTAWSTDLPGVRQTRAALQSLVP